MQKNRFVNKFVCSLCVQVSLRQMCFRVEKNCVKFVLCQGFSVEKVLCAKMPMCPYLYRHLCTKHLCVNIPSLRKNLSKSVCKVLRLKVGLWNLISLGGSICMQIVWQGAIIFEYYLNMFEFNYFIFS